MKTKIFFGAFVILTVIQVNLSCKKETSCEGCTENNKPPLRVCDQSNWPIFHVSFATIGTLSEPRTPEAGAAGARIVFGGGKKKPTIYPGSCEEVDEGSSVVDIYDASSDSWNTAELSKARLGMSIVTAGNKILFAGGYSWDRYPNGWQWNAAYSNVDIYDASSDTWQVAYLSKARYGMATAKIGNRILFAGGIFPLDPPISNGAFAASNVVDTYDFSNNNWSVATLSSAAYGLDLYGVTIGNKIYFIHREYLRSYVLPSYPGSNPGSVVDIYDNNTNTWSISDFQTVVASLSPPPGMGSVDNLDIAGDNIIFWSGQRQVGIRNISSGITSVSCISLQKPAYLINNKVVFFSTANAGNFEVFDPASGTWSVGKIDPPIPGDINYSVVQSGQAIYLGGGHIISTYCEYSNEVYKLEF